MRYWLNVVRPNLHGRQPAVRILDTQTGAVSIVAKATWSGTTEMGYQDGQQAVFVATDVQPFSSEA